MGLFMNDRRFTIKLSDEDLKNIDLYISAGEFKFRSEFVRYAIRECLDNHKKDILHKIEMLQKVEELREVFEEYEKNKDLHPL
jgi:Arc/MetJ-type ribon-helix-helix transcriptional regulator